MNTDALAILVYEIARTRIDPAIHSGENREEHRDIGATLYLVFEHVELHPATGIRAFQWHDGRVMLSVAEPAKFPMQGDELLVATGMFVEKAHGERSRRG